MIAAIQDPHGKRHQIVIRSEHGSQSGREEKGLSGAIAGGAKGAGGGAAEGFGEVPPARPSAITTMTNLTTVGFNPPPPPLPPTSPPAICPHGSRGTQAGGSEKRGGGRRMRPPPPMGCDAAASSASDDGEGASAPSFFYIGCEVPLVGGDEATAAGGASGATQTREPTPARASSLPFALPSKKHPKPSKTVKRMRGREMTITKPISDLMPKPALVRPRKFRVESQRRRQANKKDVRRGPEVGTKQTHPTNRGGSDFITKANTTELVAGRWMGHGGRGGFVDLATATDVGS
ncbi:hypothetical protein MUK42_22946 [Musa troglodytarum]|uniref:Uncharacterized protein n=1 Tax=Musa troglodytarum TaxID=320322 RepID=A0A9E7G4C0_9LILI|nr:hypothetical protein MUK42_22946 [Musa troglodytarum]